MSRKLFIICILVIVAGFAYFIRPIIFSYKSPDNNLTVLASTTSKLCDSYKGIKQVRIKWDRITPTVCDPDSVVQKQWKNFFSNPGEIVLDLNPSIAGWPTTLAMDKPWPDPKSPPQDTVSSASLAWEAQGAGPYRDITIDLECLDDITSSSFLLLSISSKTETSIIKQFMVENPQGTYRSYRPGSKTEMANYDLVKQNAKIIGYTSYFWGASRDLEGIFNGTTAIGNENEHDYCSSQFCGLGWHAGTGSSFFPMSAGMVSKYNEETGQNAPALDYCGGYGGEFTVSIDEGSNKPDKPETQKYACTASTGKCVEDTDGKFNDEKTCDDACPAPETRLYLDPGYI